MPKSAHNEAGGRRLLERKRHHVAVKFSTDVITDVPAATPSEILGEAVRRDAELDSGQVKPLSESAFWAGVRRARQ